MHAPVGSEHTQESIMPTTKQATEITAELIVTARNLENTRIEESAGKIMRLEISSVPIMRMPMTTVTAVSIAMSIL